MCSGIEYQGQIYLWQDGETHLPVQLRDGSLRWVRWGAPQGAQGPFFPGPCAQLKSIKDRHWARFNPRAVKIPAHRYMKQNTRSEHYWVSVKEGVLLQGLLATWGHEQRVYVVTTEAPTEFAHIQTQWPHVLETESIEQN